MAWREARSATLTSANRAAHDDASKERHDESTLKPTPKPTRSLSRVLLVTAGVLVIVGGGVAAVALTGDDPAPAATKAPGASDPSTPGAASSDPSPTSTAAAAAEPLAGRLLATGRAVSTGESGLTYRLPVTVRLDCADSCRVTVVRAGGPYRGAAIAYLQRVFAPSGNGTYRVSWREPLSRTSQVSSGCEALTAVGRATLVRKGDAITVRASSDRDSVPGGGGNPCSLFQRNFDYTGKLADG